MKLKPLIIILSIGLLGSIIFIAYQYTSGKKIVPVENLVSKISVTPTVAPSPTPTPILIDQTSDLKTETENLTPEDFSGDFKKLKEETLTL